MQCNCKVVLQQVQFCTLHGGPSRSVHHACSITLVKVMLTLNTGKPWKNVCLGGLMKYGQAQIQPQTEMGVRKRSCGPLLPCISVHFSRFVGIVGLCNLLNHTLTYSCGVKDILLQRFSCSNHRSKVATHLPSHVVKYIILFHLLNTIVFSPSLHRGNIRNTIAESLMFKFHTHLDCR